MDRGRARSRSRRDARPGSAVSVVQHSHDGDSAEFDVRTGVAAPTRAQRAAAKRIGATVIWNRLGTPASMSKQVPCDGDQGFKCRRGCAGLAEREQGIFGLQSTANLMLDADTRLAASNGHAVNFRQVFDGRGGGGRCRHRRASPAAAGAGGSPTLSPLLARDDAPPGDRALARRRAGARGAGRW